LRQISAVTSWWGGSYAGRLIKQSEAQEILKDARRLFEWVETKLGK